MEEYLARYPEKRKLLFEIEKKGSEKLKTCQKLQPTLDEQKPSVQSAAEKNQSSQSLMLGNYIFSKNWILATS